MRTLRCHIRDHRVAAETFDHEPNGEHDATDDDIPEEADDN
jgi:hypothetical protein